MKMIPRLLLLSLLMPLSMVSADNCTGDALIKQFANIGFQKIEIVDTMRTPRNLDREVIQGFREYRLDNYDLLRTVPKPGETDEATRIQKLNEAAQKIIFTVIIEYEQPEWALKAGIERVATYGNFIDAMGNYLIISSNKTVDVKQISKLLQPCETPLYKLFRHSAIFNIPKQWQAYKQSQPAISQITQKRDWDKANRDSPLIAAIKNENTAKIIQLLKTNPADINQKDKQQNRSPLHWLLLSDSPRMIDQLISKFVEKDIDCDTQDQYGITPLMLAAQHSLSATKAIILCGVDIQKKTEEGETALSFAQNVGLAEVVELLKNKGL